MPTKKSPSKSTTATKAAATKAAGTKAAGTKAAVAKKAAPAAAAPEAPAAVPPALEPVEAAAAANKETFETVLKAGTQAASKGYEQAIAIAQEQVEKASQSLFKGYDDAASFGKDNVDAYVASGAVFARGCEQVGKELIGIAQSAFEANVATTKALIGATTVREVIDLQTEFSRRRFDALLAESAKLTELSLSLANETIEPIQARLNATVERLMKPVAA